MIKQEGKRNGVYDIIRKTQFQADRLTKKKEYSLVKSLVRRTNKETDRQTERYTNRQKNKKI